MKEKIRMKEYLQHLWITRPVHQLALNSAYFLRCFRATTYLLFLSVLTFTIYNYSEDSVNQTISTRLTLIMRISGLKDETAVFTRMLHSYLLSQSPVYLDRYKASCTKLSTFKIEIPLSHKEVLLVHDINSKIKSMLNTGNSAILSAQKGEGDLVHNKDYNVAEDSLYSSINQFISTTSYRLEFVIKQKQLITAVVQWLFISCAITFIAFLYYTYCALSKVLGGSVIALYKELIALDTGKLNSTNLLSKIEEARIYMIKNLEESKFLAHFDPLTALPNRIQFFLYLRSCLSLAKDIAHTTVCFIDVDNFKSINDNFGHTSGDTVLKTLANRIKTILRAQDMLARMGGDEFALILPNTGTNEARHVVERILECLSISYNINAYTLPISVSIGIAVSPQDSTDMEELMQFADMAMFVAKGKGPGNYQFFLSEMRKQAMRELTVIHALRTAMENNELYMVYQPQVSLSTGKLVGAEALLRWTNSTLGEVSPDEFIRLAESSGMINDIGNWVIETVLKQIVQWERNGDSAVPFTISINMSAVQFHRVDTCDKIAEFLDNYPMFYHALEIELTETAVIRDPDTAITVIDRLHDLGILVSIDDFGIGYSSLNYLKKFKIYKLKIDRSFISNLTESIADRSIVTAIINLARGLDLRTIAEGVETSTQAHCLARLGCNEVQGYLVAKPLSAEDFITFVRNWDSRSFHHYPNLEV